MAQYADEDLDDYDSLSGEEEFNEDKLNNEEYDKLYEMLPQLKEALSSYNDQIDELKLKEALYFNYYDIEGAVGEIKERFPRKISGSLSSLATSNSKPQSKLAQLAKVRAGGAHSGGGLASLASSRGSGLASLQKFKEGRNGDSKNSSINSTQHNKASNLLSKLQASRQAPLTNEKASPLTKFADLKSKRGLRSHEDKKIDVQDYEKRTRVESELSKGTQIERKRKHSDLNLGINVDHSRLTAIPNTRLSLFLFNQDEKRSNQNLESDENSKKRRKHCRELFQPLTNIEINIEILKKVKKEFDGPSADDIVLEAQEKAFSNNLKDLSLSEHSDEPKLSENKFQASSKKTKPFKKIDLHKEFEKRSIKPLKSFVVIGHVDAGKSTLLGRLLYGLDAVDAKTVNKLVRESEKAGKGSFALAWVMDQTSEERSRGVTIDICATQFETEKTRFNAIDAPGHKDFVPQMINGVSQADFALLVVDSITGEFESGFKMDGQTKEHTLLAKNLGIEKICVVINKMDKENWSEERFNDIRFQMDQYLVSEEVGFLPEQINCIPISGLTGNNVVKRDDSIKQFDWYKGNTLVEYLENVELSSSKTTKSAHVDQLKDHEFCLSINDVFENSSSDFGISGRVSSGLIQSGESILIHPTRENLQIQSLMIGDEKVDFAIEGDFVQMTFKISQLTNKAIEDVALGDLITSVDSPVQAVKNFTASLHLFNMNKPLLIGTPFVLFRNNCHTPARISKINSIKGSKKKKRMHLVSGQTAEVEIEILDDRQFPLTTFDDNHLLGRIVIRREGTTVGAGQIGGV